MLMRKALVTGGGGFIGLAVVRKLAELGVKTTVVGRHEYPAATALGARCVVGDIREASFLQKVFADHDTVFHVAAKAGIWGSYDSYHSINVQGTENVLTACRENRVKALVYTSTPSVVFNGCDLQGVDETTPYGQKLLCHYAATKIEAEKLVLAADGSLTRTAAIRPHLVWGPGDTNLIPRLLDRGREGSLRIVGSGENKVDIAYIDNVVHAHILAADNLLSSASAGGQSFFISQGEPVPLWGWINDLYGRLDIPPVTKQVSFPAAYVIGYLMEKVYGLLGREDEPKMTRFLAEQLAKSHWFSQDKAKQLLGYEPLVSIEAGLEALVRSLRE
ncbi:MAG: NAD-dependent epimerase/dehydratase family protein [Desulfobulbaceae bacterium]|nr:NAD-dependent epimerase/dehydratase family protein [Desulfobulbaceae bacterium]